MEGGGLFQAGKRKGVRGKGMKVLMVGPDRRVHGGISQVVNNYYDAGLAQRIELRYIGTVVEGGKIRKLRKAITSFLIFCFFLPGYQIVHVNMASDVSYLRKSCFIRMAHLCRKKLVIHQHGGDFETFYASMTERRKEKVRTILNMADVFLVLAPPWKRFFSEIVENRKIVVLPDAISVPDFVPKEYGQHKILFLGRICREKGILELFQAISQLLEKYPDIKVFLGGIWEDEELQREMEKLPGTVEWLGWLQGEKKKEWLSACDIFVLPSYFEGQSVAILEAMAARCAVVASDTGGIPQMIRDGKTGILVRPKDSDSLQKGLDRALSDAAFCRSLGENARIMVENNFSIIKNMEKLLMIYERVLESRGKR